MYRRLLVVVLRRSIVLLVLVCLGCRAQSAAPELARRVERQLRIHYNVPPAVQIAVGAPKSSEFPSYETLQVTFTSGQQKQTTDFLLSKDGKTLVRFTKLDVSVDPYTQLMEKIDTSGRPVRGNKDAKVVIVNYDDFQCPFCSRMHQTLFPELVKQYGDKVKIIYKDYPLFEIHRWAIHAAVDANCLAAQNNEAYWDLADYVHAHQQEVTGEKAPLDQQFATLDRLTTEQGQKHNLDMARLQSCVKAQKQDAVQASIKEGTALGVNATPTMFVNGEKVDGALPVNELRAIFDRALRDAGVQTAASPPPPSTQAPATAAEQPTK